MLASKKKNSDVTMIMMASDQLLANKKRVLKNVQPALRALCHKVDKPWALRHLKESDIVILCYDLQVSRTRQATPRQVLKGFAFIKTLSANSVYVDLVCASKGYGSKIMRYVESVAKSLGRPVVELRALPHVIGFYNRLNYRFRSGARVRTRFTKKDYIDGIPMFKKV